MRFHAPSLSVNSRAYRSRRIRACAASRSTALAFKHSSRTTANGASTPANKPASASGATVAADAIASAFARDNFPDRIASAVAGSDSTCLDVSNMVRAADTDVPDRPASCSATDRNPARFHVAASSTRRAVNVLIVAAHRSIASASANSPGASHSCTASGSNPRAIAANSICSPRRSRAFVHRSSVTVTVTNTCSHMGETLTRDKFRK
jgi:hypothetical protein